MDFIVAQQAKNSVEIEKVIESHRQAEHRLGLAENPLDREERILKSMIRAGSRGRQDMREQDRLYAEMRESQAHSDRRLDVLIDIVRADRNGRSA